jgi:hypothetical protein
VLMTTHAANPRLHLMATGSRQYRQWAAEARRKAEAASDEPSLRQSYLGLAAACDKLAGTLERSPPADPPGSAEHRQPISATRQRRLPLTALLARQARSLAAAFRRLSRD